MKAKTERRTPEIVLRDGKPAVILDIDEYQEMLEKLENLDDLKMLEEMRKKPLKFRKLEDFLHQKEKRHTQDSKCLFSEQERDSLEHIIGEVQEFSEEKTTARAQKALRELCAGIFESEENLASNHDFFLYGAPKRK